MDSMQISNSVAYKKCVFRVKITSMLQLEVSVESSESFKVTPKDKSF